MDSCSVADFPRTFHSSQPSTTFECSSSKSTFPSAPRSSNWLANLPSECTAGKLNASKRSKTMQMNCRMHDWMLAIMKIDRLVINCDDDGDLIDMACNGVDYRFQLVLKRCFVGTRTLHMVE